jgi:hypothetical protein
VLLAGPMPVLLDFRYLLGVAYQLAARLRRLVFVGHLTPLADIKFAAFSYGPTADTGS